MSVSADSATVALALAGDGLMLVNTVSGSTRAVPFGTDAAQALDAIARVMGSPGERSTNADCGMGPLDFVAFQNGLILAIQDTRFAGWTVRPEPGATLQTMSGVGIGSTRRALDAAYAATVAQSTLGVEFQAGGLQGVLSAEGPDAVIVAFWAGASCVAR